MNSHPDLLSWNGDKSHISSQFGGLLRRHRPKTEDGPLRLTLYASPPEKALRWMFPLPMAIKEVEFGFGDPIAQEPPRALPSQPGDRFIPIVLTHKELGSQLRTQRRLAILDLRRGHIAWMSTLFLSDESPWAGSFTKPGIVRDEGLFVIRHRPEGLAVPGMLTMRFLSQLEELRGSGGKKRSC